ncbi:MAG: PilW family protein [Gammaproteobacteria bacterium]|nr:PilW family protein [Gammaproteobacteria bacterium]
MIKYPTFKNNRQKNGFSLIELMIALLLTSVVIGSVFSTFFTAKQTDRLAQSLARLQESGRFSLNYLATEVRMAGYLGCSTATGTEFNVNAAKPPVGGVIDNEVIGYDATTSNWWQTTQYAVGGNLKLRSPKLGTDILNIKIATSIDSALTGNITQNNNNITTSGDISDFISKDDLVLISDCVNADLFAATNVTVSGVTTVVTHGVATTGNTSASLAHSYDEDTVLYQFDSISYFVADTGRDNAHGDPIYALYQANENFDDDTFNSQEIVEGVENMQILYGEKSANGDMNFAKASDIGIWADVTTIKIALMLTSNNSVRQSVDNNSYSLLDVNITGVSGSSINVHQNDKRLRQIFSSSIVLRNR